VLYVTLKAHNEGVSLLGEKGYVPTWGKGMQHVVLIDGQQERGCSSRLVAQSHQYTAAVLLTIM
jgi:hypothetical protein